MADLVLTNQQVALIAAVLYKTPEGSIESRSSASVLTRADNYLQWLQKNGPKT